MSSWWSKLFDYGARAFGRQQKLVNSIQVHPIVDGKPKLYKRFYNNLDFKQHEAFLTDDKITVQMMLPSGLSIEDARQIIDTAGQFQGISPYGWKKNFGRFSVEDIYSV
jgi:hypothetical protein